MRLPGTQLPPIMFLSLYAVVYGYHSDFVRDPSSTRLLLGPVAGACSLLAAYSLHSTYRYCSACHAPPPRAQSRPPPRGGIRSPGGGGDANITYNTHTKHRPKQGRKVKGCSTSSGPPSFPFFLFSFFLFSLFSTAGSLLVLVVQRKNKLLVSLFFQLRL